MEEEIIETINKNFKEDFGDILGLMAQKHKKDKIKKLYNNSNRYEKVFILLKYKPKINHYGEIV